MNKRIFELAKQADLIQWDSLPSGARTPDHESVVRAKKFAELIVRECIVDFYRNYLDTTSDEDITEQVDKYVKEHFGVE